MNQLTAHDLTLWRGPFCLFEALSFDLSAGQALVIRGPNGSGKTTLLRVLCGLTRPETGRVDWDGVPVEQNRQAYGRALAYFGHSLGLKADLTVVQNLHFSTRLDGRGAADFGGYLTALDLANCANLEVRYLSAGQKRRTALARVLLSDARLWILDEPFTNLDDAGRTFVEERLNEHLRADGLVAAAAHHEMSIRDGEIRHLCLGASH
ncbi:MAG: cytochrome c biogenesis heme-transporting ATPase CcmA [Gammaproteobacteria bacterium]